MLGPVLRKLEAFGLINEEDRARLSDIVTVNARKIPAGREIIVEGDNPKNVHLLVSGLACRYKILADGKRQIVAYLIPGDFCDLHIFILRKIDHGIFTLAKSEVAEIPKENVEEILRRPSLAMPMLLSTLVDEATLREWVTNLGQRPANKRVAHLFCELFARFNIIGLTQDGEFQLPVTQSDLADALGLSLVHVNRSLRVLREANLMSVNRAAVAIHDIEGLREYCGFKSNYLHLNREEW